MTNLTPSVKDPYPGEFFRCISGGQLVGTSLGTGDRDEMGLCIEGPEKVIGLETFEQYTYRSVPAGERSGPGDTDLTVYSLRKFCLAVRRGEVEMDEVLTKTGLLEREISDLRHDSLLPDEPNAEVINDFLYWAYTIEWQADQ